MAYIFLSHSHTDKAFARRLAADLRNAGHAVWIDEAEINIGDSLIGKIRDGLDAVDFVCAILSESSLQSAWVQKELEIASTREIDEKRVVVLPLLIDAVELPGFLRGKFYGDFRQGDKYEDQFELLLRSLGTATPVRAANTENELAELKAQLKKAIAAASQRESEAKRAGEAAFRAKTPELRDAINAANKAFPQHAPINKTYAFQVGTTIVTLDYALWAIGKAMRKGFHPLDVLLTIENKWTDIENMLEAYDDMLIRQRVENN